MAGFAKIGSQRMAGRLVSGVGPGVTGSAAISGLVVRERRD